MWRCVCAWGPLKGRLAPSPLSSVPRVEERLEGQGLAQPGPASPSPFMGLFLWTLLESEASLSRARRCLVLVCSPWPPPG